MQKERSHVSKYESPLDRSARSCPRRQALTLLLPPTPFPPPQPEPASVQSVRYEVSNIQYDLNVDDPTTVEKITFTLSPTDAVIVYIDTGSGTFTTDECVVVTGAVTCTFSPPLQPNRGNCIERCRQQHRRRHCPVISAYQPDLNSFLKIGSSSCQTLSLENGPIMYCRLLETIT